MPQDRQDMSDMGALRIMIAGFCVLADFADEFHPRIIDLCVLCGLVFAMFVDVGSARLAA
jgi:hypothetical protein